VVKKEGVLLIAPPLRGFYRRKVAFDDNNAIVRSGLLGLRNQWAFAAKTALEFGLLVGFGLLMLLFLFSFDAMLFFGPIDSSSGETDLAFVAIDSKDFDFDLVTDLDYIFWVLDFGVGEFRDVEKPFQVILEADKDTEVGDLGDFASDQLTWLVLLRDGGIPWIIVELFHAESDTAASLVDAEDSAFDLLALL